MSCKHGGPWRGPQLDSVMAADVLVASHQDLGRKIREERHEALSRCQSGAQGLRENLKGSRVREAAELTQEAALDVQDK